MMAPHTVLSIAANYRRYRRYRYKPELVNYEQVAPDMVRAASMSEGEIDYVSFLQGLSDGGYEGPLVYEMCSPLEGGGGEDNLDAKAEDFLSCCSSIIEETG
jgi:sugar phosphate isomerase/epimerase